MFKLLRKLDFKMKTISGFVGLVQPTAQITDPTTTLLHLYQTTQLLNLPLSTSGQSVRIFRHFKP
jgi:hypothetical protein